MDRTYRIREAVARDLEAIIALDREIETLPHWRVSDYLAALSPARREPEMQAVIRCLFVAEREADAGVMGFAVGKVTLTDAEVPAELESVGVAAGARRSGVGTALCVAVIEWSRRMGARAMELEVRSRSTGPIALYEGLEFAAVGRRPRYYRDPVDDAILMRCSLAAGSAQAGSRRRDL